MDILSMAIIYIDFYSLTCIKLPVVQIDFSPESLQMRHVYKCLFTGHFKNIYLCLNGKMQFSDKLTITLYFSIIII